MRYAVCVVLGFSLLASAAAARPAVGGPPARAILQPPARAILQPPTRPVFAPPKVVHVGARAGFLHRFHDRNNYWGGFGGYLAYPGGYPDEGRAASIQSQVNAPHTTVYYGAPPLGQGDVGYVARPAIYDVAHELGRSRSFRPVPTK